MPTSRKCLVLSLLALLILLCLSHAGKAQDDNRIEVQLRDATASRDATATRHIPVDAWTAPAEGFSIDEAGDRIVVRTKTAQLAFSRTTCNIIDSTILGTSLGDTAYPNLIVNQLGKVFTQNHATTGQLRTIDEPGFLVVRGEFVLTAADGEEAFAWSVSYRICKENGYTIVTYENPTGEIRNGHYFAIEHRLNQIERHRLDLLSLGCGGIESKDSWWIPWSEHHMGVEDAVYTDGHMLNLALFTNGRIGIATEPPTSLRGFNIAAGESGYLRAETNAGARVFSWIVVNQPTTSCVGVGARMPDEMTYTLCFYPLREYRDARHMYFPAYWVTGEQMGRLGADLTENLDGGNRHTPQMNQDVHKYGGKVLFMAPNWEVTRDPTEQLHYFGEPVTFGAEDSRQQCWTCDGFRSRFFRDLMVTAVLREGGDGARLDCNTPGWCNNTEHGCDSAHSFNALTLFESMRQLRQRYDALGQEHGREFLIGSANSVYPSVNAYSDWVVAGEGNAGFPSENRADVHFNSLMYGRDFSLLIGGNSPVDGEQSRIYEQMLERCGTTVFHLATATANHARAAAWKKYTNPLLTFDVKGAAVHHPLHDDYTEFAAPPDEGLVNVIYQRPQQLLLTLCNRSEAAERGPLQLNVRAMGINSSAVLLLDVNRTTTQVVEVDDDGWLRTTIAYPPRHDVTFLKIQGLPSSPVVVWSDVATRGIDAAMRDPHLSITARGLPGLASRLLVYCPRGFEPAKAVGGTLEAFNQVDRIAFVHLLYDSAGEAEVELPFSEGAQATTSLSVDMDAAVDRLQRYHLMVRRLNYPAALTVDLDEVCREIRNGVQFISADLRAAILEQAEDAQRLLFCQEKIIDSLNRVRGLPLWAHRNMEVPLTYVRNTGAVPIKWAISGPYSNVGFNETYGLEPDVRATTRDAVQQPWRSVEGFFLDLGYAIEVPEEDALGQPLRNRIAFARTTIHSPKARSALLQIDGTGSMRIWLNGQSILTSVVDGQHPAARQRTPIRLREGANELLIKTESGSHWALYPLILDSGRVVADLGFTVDDVAPADNPYAHAFFVNVCERLGLVQ
jgi:hypothetical protein